MNPAFDQLGLIDLLLGSRASLKFLSWCLRVVAKYRRMARLHHKRCGRPLVSMMDFTEQSISAIEDHWLHPFLRYNWTKSHNILLPLKQLILPRNWETNNKLYRRWVGMSEWRNEQVWWLIGSQIPSTWGWSKYRHWNGIFELWNDTFLEIILECRS